MPIKTASAKAKGRALQQYVRDRIMETYPWLREGDVESRSMGASGVDVMLSPAAREVFPISVEAKKTKKVPSKAEMDQAKANAYPDTVAAVVWAGHGQGPSKAFITFEFNEFLAWWKGQQCRDPNFP